MKQNLRVHCFQHTACDSLSSCQELLLTHHAQISKTEFFALPSEVALDIDALPQVEDVDLLIVMGGRINADDEINCPWLKIEKRWIRRYIAMHKPVIGLCVGGQIIASALGAPVIKNDKPYMAWNTVKGIQNLPEHCFQMPPEMHVMSLGSDIPVLPKGAIPLVVSDKLHNQCYQIGHNILGFQFSLEITEDGLNHFLDKIDTSLDVDPLVVQVKNTPKNYFIDSQIVLNQALEFVLR